MQRRLNRRTVLQGAAGAGIAGLAGCIGGPGTDGGGDGNGDGNGGQQNGQEIPSPGGGGGERPDVLVIIGYPQSGLQMFRDYYSSAAAGDEDILVPDGLQDAEMQQQVGNPMENVTGTVPTAAGPNRQAFIDLFQDEYNASPGAFTSHTFDSVAALILANAAAGENSGPSVRDQMRRIANPDGQEYGPGELAEAVAAAARGEAINYQGASSPVDFDENGDPAAAAYDVWKFAPDSESGFETLSTLEFSGNAGGPMADSSPGGTGRDVRVGILLPQTGDLASLGGPMVNAAELAVKTAQGTDADITIDHQVEDSQTDPQAGISAANALVNAGYPAVCGSASSGVNVPVSQQVFIPNQVVGCSPSSTALSVTHLEDDDFIFRTAPSDLLQGQVMAQVSAEDLGAQTAVTLYVNNDYGQQLQQQFAESFEQDHSGTVLRQVSFIKEQDSYTAVLQQALEG